LDLLSSTVTISERVAGLDTRVIKWFSNDLLRRVDGLCSLRNDPTLLVDNSIVGATIAFVFASDDIMKDDDNKIWHDDGFSHNPVCVLFVSRSKSLYPSVHGQRKSFKNIALDFTSASRFQ
jgi:hypothetical protein